MNAGVAQTERAARLLYIRRFATPFLSASNSEPKTHNFFTSRARPAFPASRAAITQNFPPCLAFPDVHE
jgi:hypothetical protein